jgi:hypothetical protein
LSLGIILGESKIGDLVEFVLDEDVGRFEISMNDFVFVEIPITCN